MATYLKKQSPIEAFRLGIDNIPDWFMDKVSTNEIVLRGEWGDLQRAEIKIMGLGAIANKGDFIIKDGEEIYPCIAKIFEIVYEPVEVAQFTNA